MPSLLLVEDDSRLRRCLMMCLQEEGWDVEGVSSVEDATQRLDGREFDLVVTDYHLSDGRDGLSLLTCLRGLASRPPAILISGKNMESAARESGAFRFLRKPFDLGVFVDSCRHAVQGHPAGNSEN